MFCLRCEVARAKLYALAALTVGNPLEAAADRLSQRYGARYYVKDGVLWRDHNPKAIRIYGEDTL